MMDDFEKEKRKNVQHVDFRSDAFTFGIRREKEKKRFHNIICIIAFVFSLFV